MCKKNLENTVVLEQKLSLLYYSAEAFANSKRISFFFMQRKRRIAKRIFRKAAVLIFADAACIGE